MTIDIEPADYFGESHSDGSAVILVTVGDESRATTANQFMPDFSLGAIEDIVPPDEQDVVVREIYFLISQ